MKWLNDTATWFEALFWIVVGLVSAGAAIMYFLWPFLVFEDGHVSMTVLFLEVVFIVIYAAVYATVQDRREGRRY